MIRCKIINSGIQALVLTVFFFTSFTINAQTIVVGGSNWSIPITPITEAGMDYTGTFESIDFTISGNLPGSFLNLLSGKVTTVSVQYVPNTWNTNLHLYAKRTGGTATISGLCVLCSASINNGTTYVEILPNTNTSFFTINFSGALGLGNSVSYSGINTQLKISGVSVTVPADSYSATIVFTIAAL